MREDPPDHDGEAIYVDIVPLDDTPYTVATLLIRNPRPGLWEASCIAPDDMALPDLAARGETLSETLLELSDMVEDWEAEQNAD